MDIILHITLFYIHLIFTLAPYLLSGVAVWTYYQYKEAVQFEDAVRSYMSMTNVDREAAIQAITTPPPYLW